MYRLLIFLLILLTGGPVRAEPKAELSVGGVKNSLVEPSARILDEDFYRHIAAIAEGPFPNQKDIDTRFSLNLQKDPRGGFKFNILVHDKSRQDEVSIDVEANFSNGYLAFYMVNFKSERKNKKQCFNLNMLQKEMSSIWSGKVKVDPLHGERQTFTYMVADGYKRAIFPDPRRPERVCAKYIVVRYLSEQSKVRFDIHGEY